jgi:hypothetical protein
MTDEMRTPPEGGWESLKVDELKAELEARGLPKSGKKDELIARLVDDEVAQQDNVAARRPPRHRTSKRPLPRRRPLRRSPPAVAVAPRRPARSASRRRPLPVPTAS